MNIKDYTIATPEHWIKAINTARPKMQADDKRRAKRTIRYLDKVIKGKRGHVW